MKKPVTPARRRRGTVRTETRRPRGAVRTAPLASSAEAEALGVSRSHLWRVLAGKRESASLLLRHEEYAKEAAK